MTLLLVLSMSKQGNAQTNSNENSFLDRTEFTINTEWFSQKSSPASNDYLKDVQRDIFYDNAFYRVEMDYFITDQISVNAGLSYFGGRTNRDNSIVFVIAPPPDAITHFSTSYNFKSLSLEPEAKILFKLHKLGFFWSAGPILAIGFVNTNIKGAAYGNPNDFSNYKHFGSHSFGLGTEASTGLQYLITKKIGLSVEIGYKTLRYGSLYTKLDFPDDKIPLDYRLNTVFQRLGIIFKL